MEALRFLPTVIVTTPYCHLLDTGVHTGSMLGASWESRGDVATSSLGAHGSGSGLFSYIMNESLSYIMNESLLAGGVADHPQGTVLYETRVLKHSKFLKSQHVLM